VRGGGGGGEKSLFIKLQSEKRKTSRLRRATISSDQYKQCVCEEVRVQEADPHIAGQVGASYERPEKRQSRGSSTPANLVRAARVPARAPGARLTRASS